MNTSEREYFGKRAIDARRKAEQTNDSSARAVHLEMAILYDLKAQGFEPEPMTIPKSNPPIDNDEMSKPVG